jgi:peptidoglycan/LPS O-acetylase OafA/YrhL
MENIVISETAPADISGPELESPTQQETGSDHAAGPSPGRVIGLDVLRFLAVSVVMAPHLTPLRDSDGRWPRWMEAVGHGLQIGGGVGVDLFFVLSGFLVSGLLFREWQRCQSVSIGRFLLRRGFKIYPSFWFFLAAIIFLSAIGQRPTSGVQAITLKGVLGELLFLQNFFASILFHTWSLAVEEHFYFLLAVLTWFLVRRRSADRHNPFAWLPWFFLCAAVGCLLARVVSNMFFPPNRTRHIFFATYLRLDALFFGVLLSYLWHFQMKRWHNQLVERWRWVLGFAGLALMVPAFCFDPQKTWWIRVFGYNLYYVAGGLLLLSAIAIFSGSRSRTVRFIAYLGANSYPVYLWHWVAVNISGSFFNRSSLTLGQWMLHYLIAFVVAWMLGLAAARLVEFPVLRLRDRWVPTRAPALPTRNDGLVDRTADFRVA